MLIKNDMLFSIVTINLNNNPGLEKTLNSVLSQKFDAFEYIVIDGASNDGSVETIKKHASQITYWVSESDTGIYNAMNKGIKVAQGEFILFLNSGDIFASDDVLQQVAQFINQNDEICTGDTWLDKGENRLLQQSPDFVSFEHLYTGSISHPSSFIHRSLFDKYGLYNENLKIVSDWEFFFKALILHNATYKKLPFPISVFDMDGISQNPVYKNTHDGERLKIIKALVPFRIREYISQQDNLKNITRGKRFQMLQKIEQKKLPRFLLQFLMQLISIFINTPLSKNTNPSTTK